MTKNYVRFEAWLKSNLHGYADLHPEIKRVMLYFSVAWSLFEHKALGDESVRQGIDNFLIERIPLDLDLRPFQPAMQHFVGRYVEEGKTNEAFEDLVRGNLDLKEYIRPVLIGERSRSRTQIQALLFIIYCLRNNMIHGVKWRWGYQNQLNNLDHSIGVLNFLLDAYVPRDPS